MQAVKIRLYAFPLTLGHKDVRDRTLNVSTVEIRPPSIRIAGITVLRGKVLVKLAHVMYFVFHGRFHFVDTPIKSPAPLRQHGASSEPSGSPSSGLWDTNVRELSERRFPLRFATLDSAFSEVLFQVVLTNADTSSSSLANSMESDLLRRE